MVDDLALEVSVFLQEDRQDPACISVADDLALFKSCDEPDPVTENSLEFISWRNQLDIEFERLMRAEEALHRVFILRGELRGARQRGKILKHFAVAA